MSEIEDNRLVDYLYGEMDQAEMRAFEDVMQDDAQLSDSVQGFESMLDTIRTVETETAPAHLDSLILARARQEQTESGSWISRLLARPTVALAFSGACALVAAVILIPQTSPFEAGVEAPAVVMEKAKTAKGVAKAEALEGNDDKPAEMPESEAIPDTLVGGLGAKGEGLGGGGTAGHKSAESQPIRAKAPLPAARTQFGRVEKATAVPKRPAAKRKARRKPSAPVKTSRKKMRAQSSPRTSPARAPSAAAPDNPPPGPTIVKQGFTSNKELAAPSVPAAEQDSAPSKMEEKAAPSLAKKAAPRAPSAVPKMRGGRSVARGRMDSPAPPADESTGFRQTAESREAWARNLARDAQKKAKQLIQEKRIGDARRVYLELRPSVRGTMAFFELSLWLAQLEYGQGRYASARKYAQEASRSRDQRVQNKAREVVARVREDQGHPNSRPASTTEPVAH